MNRDHEMNPHTETSAWLRGYDAGIKTAERSAFSIIVLGCILGFGLGVLIGYGAACGFA